MPTELEQEAIETYERFVARRDEIEPPPSTSRLADRPADKMPSSRSE